MGHNKISLICRANDMILITETEDVIKESCTQLIQRATDCGRK